MTHVYNFISKRFSFLSLGDAVGKLEATKSVTSAFQQTKGVNILTFENWKEY
jgi:hypothetical protein